MRFVRKAVLTCGRSRRGRAARAADRSRRAHHVIPKSLLKAQGYETGEIHEIVNMALIAGQTNRRISNKDATAYLADVVAKQGAAALRSQCVPTDPALWDKARSRDFLALRREELAVRMNAFIKDKAELDAGLRRRPILK